MTRLNSTTKKDTENFILKNKIYTSLEYFYGNTHPFWFIIYCFTQNILGQLIGI